MSRSSLAFAEVTAPSAAVALESRSVAALAVERRGGSTLITGHASEALPEGALAPSLTTENVRDQPAIVAAVARVLERVGNPRRVGLVVPDPVAKVSLVKFQSVPARAADLDQLVQWQVRKAAPFAIEEAQLSYVPGTRGADGQEFIVSVARRAVIREYEAICEAAGAHAGIVDLSTFNVINTALATGSVPAGDWLLVNVAADWASIAILRGPHLVFFRSRTADGEGTLPDLVHQTAMYYEDRLKGSGFDRVMLCGGSGPSEPHHTDVEQLHRSLAARLGRPVHTVDPTAAAALTDTIAARPALLDTLAPLVGLLVRYQPEAVR